MTSEAIILVLNVTSYILSLRAHAEKQQGIRKKKNKHVSHKAGKKPVKLMKQKARRKKR